MLETVWNPWQIAPMASKKMTPMSFRVSEEMKKKLEIIAQNEFRPVSNQVEFFLNQAIDRYIESHEEIWNVLQSPDNSK